MDSIAGKSFVVENPYNGAKRIVPAYAEDVHSIVFWSKDFGPFLDGKYGEKLKKSGYNLYFNFTVNSEDIIFPIAAIITVSAADYLKVFLLPRRDS